MASFCSSSRVGANPIAIDAPSTTIMDSVSHESDEAVLIDFFNSVPHYVVLKDWRIEETALRRRVHRKEQNLSATESEIYQLLGIFSLFQGVVFGALAQTNILQCKDWLSPFCLSFLVSVATLLAVEQKTWAFAAIQTELTRARQEVEVLYDCMVELIDQGSRFDLNRLNTEPRMPPLPQGEDSNLVSKLLFEYILTRGFAVRGLVIVLSIIILVSCPRILCRTCKCQP